MARRIPPELNKKRYPTPTRWHDGFVSRAQARKFERTPSLRKYFWGMLAHTGSGTTRAARLRNLPQRVRRVKRRR